MRHFLSGAVAALALALPAHGQDFVPPSFNEMELDCRTNDETMPMVPICHVLVYEQWRLFSKHTADQSFCDTNLFWVAADAVLTKEQREGPFDKAIDTIILESGVCRVVAE